jgi:hypothetical protein
MFTQYLTDVVTYRTKKFIGWIRWETEDLRAFRILEFCGKSYYQLVVGTFQPAEHIQLAEEVSFEIQKIRERYDKLWIIFTVKGDANIYSTEIALRYNESISGNICIESSAAKA